MIPHSFTSGNAPLSSATCQTQSKYITAKIDDLTKNSHTIVIIGYSGQGYENIEKLKEIITGILTQASMHSDKPLRFVIGLTKEGIGAAYEMIKDFFKDKNIDVKTIGIVSSNADKSSFSEYCDEQIIVDTEKNEWQVKNDQNKSFMVYAATTKPSINRTGEVFGLGAGGVGLEELREADKEGIKTTIYPWIKSAHNADKGTETLLSTESKFIPRDGEEYIVLNQSQYKPAG